MSPPKRCPFIYLALAEPLGRVRNQAALLQYLQQEGGKGLEPAGAATGLVDYYTLLHVDQRHITLLEHPGGVELDHWQTYVDGVPIEDTGEAYRHYRANAGVLECQGRLFPAGIHSRSCVRR